MRANQYDAIVVGAGPNGLAAAVTLSMAGIPTLVVEAHATAGGGARTSELTLPGFRHDVCSAVHPLGVGSPFFRTLGLERHGLEWLSSRAELAHVYDDHTVLTLERSLSDTAAQFGHDGPAYQRLLEPFVHNFERLMPMLLAPLRFPSAPWLLARFGLLGLHSMEAIAAGWFRERPARALLAGIAAHATLRLDALATTSFALVLASAGHAVGWPVARGGSDAIIAALIACLRSHGGEVTVNQTVTSLADLPPARAYLLDVAPRDLASIASKQLSPSYKRRLERFRHGPGVCKVDWALSEPIPWKDARCLRSGTVHLAGTFSDVAEVEARVNAGGMPERPFVLLGQPSLFDSTRAPQGKHTAWAYCHVPHGSSADATLLIEQQIERYAPGFRDVILARATKTALDVQRYSPTFVGGDISGGQPSLSQLFFRPVTSLDPYATSAPEVFICSSSTPPGGGVHGMCGYWAARSALRRVFGKPAPTLWGD